MNFIKITLFALLSTPLLLSAQPADFPTYQPHPVKTERGLFGKGTVGVPAGTQLLLYTQDVIDPSRVSEGQLVFFTVAEDVVVDGKVVVATNARATGRINFIEAPTSSSPGRISIKVQSVRDVSGTKLLLNGVSSIEQGALPGSSMAVPAGRLVEAYTLNNTKVKL